MGRHELTVHPAGSAVTIAVVSYNTRAHLASCLASLEPCVREGLAAVWVVDNASTDGSADLAAEQAPWATLVRAERNLGFGAAVDLVAGRVDTAWIAPANADVTLEPAALERLLDAGADPRTAVVAPRLVLPGGETQHSVQRFPTLGLALVKNLGLHRLSRSWADRLCLVGYWDPDRRRTVDWAVGAFMLVRREAFEQVGGFDARQWLYAEDLDLCWRLSDAGYVTRYEPDAVVRHHESAATWPAFGEQRTERYMAATYAVIARRRGRLRARATGLLNCAGAGLRVALRIPPGAREANRQWLHAHRAGLRALD